MELNSLDDYLNVVSLQDVLSRLYNSRDSYSDIDFTSAESIAKGIVNYAGKIGYTGPKNVSRLTEIVSNSLSLGKEGKFASKKDIYNSYRNFSARYKYNNKDHLTPVEALDSEKNELLRYQSESENARAEIHNLRVSRAKNHAIVVVTLGIAFMFKGMRNRLKEIKNGIRYNKTKLDNEKKLESQKLAIDAKLDIIRKNNIIFEDHGPWQELEDSLENNLDSALDKEKPQENTQIIEELPTKEIYAEQKDEISNELEENNRENNKDGEHILEELEVETPKPVAEDQEEYETGARVADYGEDNEVGPEDAANIEPKNEDISDRKRKEFFLKEQINNILSDEANYKNPKYYQSLNSEKTNELFAILEEHGKEGGLLENTPIAQIYNGLKTKNVDRKRESLLEGLMKNSSRPQNKEEYVTINENGKIQIYNDNKYAPKAEAVDLKKIEEVKEENPEDFGGDNMEVDVHYKKDEIPPELIAEKKKGAKNSARTN